MVPFELLIKRGSFNGLILLFIPPNIYFHTSCLILNIFKREVVLVQFLAEI